MQKQIRSRAQLYGVAAIILALVLGTFCYNFGVFLQVALPSPIISNTLFRTFSSYGELKNFLTTNSVTQGPFQINGIWGNSLKKAGSPVFDYNTQSSTPSYSSTNIQVAGVDEADIVKNDGKYIYVVSGRSVSILKAYPPDEAQLLSSIGLGNVDGSGIFLNRDRLAVLAQESSYPQVFPYELPPYGFKYVPQPNEESQTFVKVYDISDRVHPVFLREYKVSGSYIGSRMIGDYVYFVASQPAYVYSDAVALPMIYTSDGEKTVSPTEIHYNNVSDNYFQFTTFFALNIQNTMETPTYMTIMLGGTNGLYVSLNNMYVTFHRWQGVTSIYRMHIANSTVTCEANGTVLGHELDQFSMDEYDGYFRIATNAWVNGIQQNNLYVLDMNLSVVGKLENLATGENLHSVRLMGNRGYVVTFIKTDPLFVIDLSEPTNPTVLGELHIPGYSDYLHPYDETHLIGVGKQTVEAEQGYFAWYQGVKVSLFDVTNVTNPKQISTYVIGDRGSDSLVLSDHKAFLFDKTMNLLVIPVDVTKINENEYPGGVPPYVRGELVWQGAYVFRVSLEGGFVFRGGITHWNSSTSMGNDAYSVKRSLYIGNVLYTVSDKKVRMNDLDNLAPINEIDLP